MPGFESVNQSERASDLYCVFASKRVRVTYWDANNNMKQVTKTINRERVFAYNHGITDLNLSERVCVRAHINFSRLQNSTRLQPKPVPPAKPTTMIEEQPLAVWTIGQTEMADWGQVTI